MAKITTVPREEDQETVRVVHLRLTKQGGLANTAVIGEVTYRKLGVGILLFVVGVLLFITPLFKWNWFAMAAYVALASIIIGQTPTQRSVLSNIYGIVFKKPIRMVVSDQNTVTTFCHGVREVVLDEMDVDATPFKMSTGLYALVYNINSGINQWSTESDHIAQASQMKKLFNILEGGESVVIVEKQDSDTGMLQLRDTLQSRENFDTSNSALAAMSAKRQTMLHRAGTTDVGRSVQQYAVVMVKPRNMKRVVAALRSASRLTRPATNPADVLLAISGFEGGVEYHESVQEKG